MKRGWGRMPWSGKNLTQITRKPRGGHKIFGNVREPRRDPRHNGPKKPKKKGVKWKKTETTSSAGEAKGAVSEKCGRFWGVFWGEGFKEGECR